MTADELKSKIKFSSRKMDGMTIAKATIQVDAFIEIADDIMPPQDLIEERLSEMLMRRLYEDQRQELYEAVDKLRTANPMNSAEWRKAIEELTKVAMRQPKP